jgi:hypothetical protein
VTVFALAILCASAVRPVCRLLSQVVWLRFCNRLLNEPDGVQRLQRATPHVLAGLAAAGDHTGGVTRVPE